MASLYCSTEEVPAADLAELMRRSYATFDHEEVVPTLKALFGAAILGETGASA